jgi:hypothetical protein
MGTVRSLKLNGRDKSTPPRGVQWAGRALGTMVVATALQVSSAPIPGLFNTGTSTQGGLLAAGLVDPHYWLVASADGLSPGLAKPSFGENNPQAWSASARIGGSPGMADPVPSGFLENIVINEFLAHTEPPNLGYVELYNHSPVPATSPVASSRMNRLLISSSSLRDRRWRCRLGRSRGRLPRFRLRLPWPKVQCPVPAHCARR